MRPCASGTRSTGRRRRRGRAIQETSYRSRTTMIERYALPEMTEIWSERTKLDKWLQVELAVCEAWTELGEIPQDAMDRLRKATFDEQRVAEILVRTLHDMTAFTRAGSESLGDERRFIHLGLTSSDVIDTALSLQLLDAADLLLAELAKLEQ